MDINLLLDGAVALAIGMFGWIVKGTSDKANKAASDIESLKSRVVNVENQVNDVQEIKVSVGVLQTEIKNINSTLNRVESILIRKT